MGRMGPGRPRWWGRAVGAWGSPWAPWGRRRRSCEVEWGRKRGIDYYWFYLGLMAINIYVIGEHQVVVFLFKRTLMRGFRLPKAKPNQIVCKKKTKKPSPSEFDTCLILKIRMGREEQQDAVRDAGSLVESFRSDIDF